MNQNEHYVLRVLEEVGLVTRPQIEKARTRLNGADNVVERLVEDGIVSTTDISRAMIQRLQVACDAGLDPRRH